jgi:hypothetical protein
MRVYEVFEWKPIQRNSIKHIGIGAAGQVRSAENEEFVPPSPEGTHELSPEDLHSSDPRIEGIHPE